MHLGKEVDDVSGGASPPQLGPYPPGVGVALACAATMLNDIIHLALLSKGDTLTKR